MPVSATLHWDGGASLRPPDLTVGLPAKRIGPARTGPVMITLRETHELHALRQRTHIGYPPQPPGRNGICVAVVEQTCGCHCWRMRCVAVHCLTITLAAMTKFSTYMMLSFGKQDARRLIHGAAYGYKDYVRNPKVTVPLQAFGCSWRPNAALLQSLVHCLRRRSGSVQRSSRSPAPLRDARPISGALAGGACPGCRIEFGSSTSHSSI